MYRRYRSAFGGLFSGCRSAGPWLESGGEPVDAVDTVLMVVIVCRGD
jgi:hypothetical protein